MDTSLRLDPDALLTTTRSVRKRLDLTRPVPLELIEECLRIALQAPSGGNVQNWHWMVVTDPEQRQAIGSVYRAAVQDYIDSPVWAGKLFGDDPQRAGTQQRVGDSITYLGDHIGDVPVLMIPCVDVGADGLPEGNQAILWGSLLPAAWSYMLAARARGLGVAWTCLHLFREPEVAKILSLPDNIRQGAMLPTAYSIGTTFKPAARQPLESVLHHDRW
jgi:nitroreductase